MIFNIISPTVIVPPSHFLHQFRFFCFTSPVESSTKENLLFFFNFNCNVVIGMVSDEFFIQKKTKNCGKCMSKPHQAFRSIIKIDYLFRAFEEYHRWVCLDTHTPLSIWICSFYSAQKKPFLMWKQNEQCSIEPVQWFRAFSAFGLSLFRLHIH